MTVCSCNLCRPGLIVERRTAIRTGEASGKSWASFSTHVRSSRTAAASCDNASPFRAWIPQVSHLWGIQELIPLAELHECSQTAPWVHRSKSRSICRLPARVGRELSQIETSRLRELGQATKLKVTTVDRSRELCAPGPSRRCGTRYCIA